MNLKKGFLFSKNSGIGKRGQIWVETVIYTLIAFAIMGLVLAFVLPQIREAQDKGTIEQTIKVMQDVDSTIKNLGGPGNQRILKIGIGKGSLNVDSESDRIFFEIESEYQYSQPGQGIDIGSLRVFTVAQGNINIVTISLDYTDAYNITYMKKEEEKVLTKAPVPYEVAFYDNGQDASGNPIINLEVIG
jgi:type II secretory pathway pseudopilin PulG